MAFTEEDLKKMLMTFGEGLSHEMLEDCIKECLGNDFKSNQKRVFSDDESKEDIEYASQKDQDIEYSEKGLDNAISKLYGKVSNSGDPMLEKLGTILEDAVDDDDEKYVNQVAFYNYLSLFLDVLNAKERKDTEAIDTLSDELESLAEGNEYTKKLHDKTIKYKERKESIIAMIFKNRNRNNIKQIIQIFLNDVNNSDFGKLVRKSTEKVRSIAKKKGIYIIGRKNRKFLGIKFLKSGNYSKNKKKKPNCKEYSYDQIRKMKNTKYKIDWKKSKLPELIEKMNIKDVKRKFGNFQFGFELLPQRGCGSKFGYTFPKGTSRGYGSALLYSKI